MFPRFCAEFGMQSFPSVETLSTCMSPDDFNVTSPIMEHHQRHPQGNAKIIEYLSREFRFPLDFEKFIYITQVHQAIAIKTGSEHWRRIKPQNMGVIYWQLNDIWQGMSWSSLEYDGRWKMLHYAAKKFFAPVLLSAYDKDEVLYVWLTSDKNESLKGTALIYFKDFLGNTLSSKEMEYVLQPQESKLIIELPLNYYIPKTMEKEEVFVVLESEVNGERIENLHFFTPLKHCPLQKATLRINTAIIENKIRIKIESDIPAFFVWLNAGKTAGIFSDNGFFILPGQIKEVDFQLDEHKNLRKIAESISCVSLRDTY